jgi:hypothetical protein
MGDEQIQPAVNPPGPGAAVADSAAVSARLLPPPLPTAIAVGSAPAAPPASAVPPAKKKTTPPEPKDSPREVVETVVFVVVLVLLLKTFLAEAFVIPTGSMADTLLGYHKVVQCEQCGYRFPVNLSGQVDPEDRPRRWVTVARCPNCEYENRIVPLEAFPKTQDAP